MCKKPFLLLWIVRVGHSSLHTWVGLVLNVFDLRHYHPIMIAGCGWFILIGRCNWFEILTNFFAKTILIYFHEKNWNFATSRQYFLKTARFLKIYWNIICGHFQGQKRAPVKVKFEITVVFECLNRHLTLPFMMIWPQI